MLKEIPKQNVDYNLVIGSLTTSEHVNMKFLSPQDTTKVPSFKTKVTNSDANKLETTVRKVLSVQKKDSTKKLSTPSTLNPNPIVNNVVTDITADSLSSVKVEKNSFPFYPGYTAETYQYNFLLDIPNKVITQDFNERVGINKTVSIAVSKASKTVQPKNAVIEHAAPSGFQGNSRANASMDWLPAILLVSLFTFSWIKMLYQKYVVQVVASLVNYQASLRLLREKNVLFRNMSIGLNFVFAINIGLFIFLCIQCYNVGQIHPNNFLSTLIYCTAVTILFNIKTVVCKLLGNLFLVKEQFAEYVHNIHLFNKNIGLFLFPIVVTYPYITNNHIKPIIINIGLFIVISMSLLLIYRGFQIIVRSGVSIFYLILYLCAVEILPILILVKYSYTLI